MKFHRTALATLLFAVFAFSTVAAWASGGQTGPDPVVKKWPSWPHQVICGRLPFDPIAAFSRPTNAERGGGGAERALRRFLRRPGWGWIPKRRWRLVAENSSIAEFVQGRASAHIEREMSSLAFEKQHGRWQWYGSGGCIPRTLRHGLPAAEWSLYNEGSAPNPNSTALEVGISERSCSSGADPLPRLQKPEVIYTDTAALITFWVRPRRGPQTCPGIAPARYELQLPGPLDGRRLYDAGTYPPVLVKAE